ncbi:putative hydrolase or acyltransferase of alpha/beta superfamily [Methylocaldum marinum]|uniref:Putative hydrolase or acyltransferase of alpha/beta superfamily n=1 Tax=Methylocaldum marinum TaxID=1432792 RepID=A0A250KQM3_9GAMM|nr:putative hydrolase or acyltransferase of alpha/beta superfamily [Methylocaldum marinum]
MEALPYTDSHGIRIHYQVEGNGPPLVMQHGFTSSSNAWSQFGYVQGLCRDYRCILLDARGHGASDKPHDPAAYALTNRVADVVAVLDALRIQQANFLGFSMGGWIGFGMAKYAPERINALLIVGAHPYADPSWDAFRNVDGTDPGAFLAALESVLEQRIPTELRPLVLTNDLRALAAAAQERPALDDVLPTLAMPCLLIVGEDDARCPAVRECARHLSDATVVALPGLKHTESFIRSDLVLPHVKRFLAGIQS